MSLPGCMQPLCSLSVKSKERLACDVFDTFATFQLVVNCVSMKSKERLACDVFDTFARFQPCS